MLEVESTVVGMDPIRGISSIHLGVSTILQDIHQVPNMGPRRDMPLGTHTLVPIMRWLLARMSER